MAVVVAAVVVGLEGPLGAGTAVATATVTTMKKRAARLESGVAWKEAGRGRCSERTRRERLWVRWETEEMARKKMIMRMMR